MSRQVTDRKTTSLPKGHSRFALRTNLVSCPPVQNVATPHKFTEAALLSRERFPVAFALSVLFLGALWFGLCRELSGEWSVNEQYNFGWFVPFFAALPFLAPVAGQAAGANFKSQLAYRIFSSAWDGDCCAAVAAAASSL